MRFVARAAAMLAGSMLMVGCSVEHRLDRDGLQAQVLAELFPEHPGLVSAINCPELADPEPGLSFVCAAQIGEQIIDVPVTLGGEPEALTASVWLDDRFVAAAELAELLADTFTTEIEIETTVDCGQPIVVLDPGTALKCLATDPSGRQRHFDVTVDDDGNVNLSLT